MTHIKIKRIYDTPAEDDGKRILVDRMWPRGVSHERAKLDLWCKDIAPSPGLRKKFGHLSENYDEFREGYFRELNENAKTREFCDIVRKADREGNVTLLYAAKDVEHNNAVVLRDWLKNK